MKNIMKKLFIIITILMMFNINLTKESKAAEVTDEFAELLTTYESEAPSIESAELSTTFTSNKEVEVYIKTSRKDISKVNISAWSGGPYKQYLVSKEAKFDELRNVYTVLFPLNEIVNTTTNQIEKSSEVLYYFDACIYSTNGSMSYVKLDEVQYTETGIKTQVTKNEEEKQVIEVKAEEDGYVAIVNAGEEVTENTNWQPVSKGVNTYALPEATEEVQNVQVLYKAGAEVTEEDIENGNVTSNEIMLLSEGEEEPEQQDPNMSYFQDNETFTFEFSQNSGANDWIAYTDTPNVLESRIQGMHGTEAVATIKIKTEYPGVLSFDYMVSSEENFDKFSIEIEGAKLTNENKERISLSCSGQKVWENYTQSYEKPENGTITIILKYSKDFNINRYDDKAAIRNLTFEPEIPEIPEMEGNIVINNGTEFANNATLNLTLNAQSFTKMYITEVEKKPEASDANWQAYQNTATYTLQDTADGLKTVYVYYMNEAGAITLRPIEASIKLDTSVPTTVAPRVESTANTITAYLNQIDANEFITVYYGYRLSGSTDEYTWSENVRVNDLADVSEYTISGLTEIQEYEVVTKVSDGVNGDIVSEVSTIKTKIPSDGIVIIKSTEDATLGEVVVNIEWNNTEYIKECSLDGTNWTVESANVTTITLTENATIYYRMKNDTYDTGILECEISNIDHGGPQVEKIEVIEPVSGTYGMDDEITIQLTWNEETTVVTAPTLNIKFEDNNVVSLIATEQTSTTLTYKYTIVGTDAGYLSVDSLTGGLVKDNFNQEAIYELPELTGSKIYVENMAYIASTNKYYGTLQRAINASGTEATTIKLTANNVLRDTVVIKEGQNIVLDLNGKTVSYESEENIVTAIENRGTLEIIDSTVDKTGLILASSKTKSAYTIVNNPTGNLTIKDVKVEAISESTSVSLESYALYNKGAGTITLGTNDSEVSVTKTELKATAKNSYGLYIANAEGMINYYDGIIKGTKKATYTESGILTYVLPVGYSEKVELRNEDGKDYEVAYLSNELAVELTMNGITTGYKSILEAVAKVPTDGRKAKIKMLTDETLEDIVKIYKGQNIEIDLNSYVLTRTEDIDGYVYALINNGTLKISDTSETETGEIRAIALKDVTTYAVYNYTDGDLTIDGGKYFAQINIANKKKYAYGLESNSSKNIVMNNGEIYREEKFFDSSKSETPSGKYLKQRYEVINGIEYKVNYVSTSPNVTLTVNGVTTGYSGVQQAVDIAQTDGTLAIIKMESDVELINYIQIPENKNIQLNLNGKTIKVNDLMYGIYTKASLLEIKDDSLEQTGTINFYGILDGYYYCVYNAGTGTIKIDGGVINVDSAAYSARIDGVRNASSGTINIDGGTISVNTSGARSDVSGVCNISSGIIKINGGIITAFSNYMGRSFGVDNVSSGTIEINGGTISGSYTIYNERNGRVEINAGEINSSVYAVYNVGAGTIEINGGIIDSFYSSSNFSSYGVYNKSSGTLEINGGIISAMTNEHFSYGVYINDKEAKIKLTGGELKGGTNGIYIPEGMEINNSGTEEKGKVNIPQDKHIGYREQSGYIVNYIEDGAYVAELTIGEMITQHLSMHDAINSIPTDGSLGIVKLLQNESLGRSIDIKEGQNVKIDLNGKEIRSTEQKSIINNGNLKIIDSSLMQTGTINFYGILNGYSYCVYNAGSGIVELNGCTIHISSVYSPEYSSSNDYITCVYNASSGIVKLNRVKISGYFEEGNIEGKAVSNGSSGMIEINECTINISSRNSVGVANSSSGIIEINESSIKTIAISNSYGVYNESNGMVEINGCTINSFSSAPSISYSYGVYNKAKGTITIGKNDDILMNNQIEIISKHYGIYINKIGGSINLYDGIIKAATPIYPTKTVFETGSEVSETSYMINIPVGTEICDGTEGQYKTKYLRFKDDYIPEDEIEDKESPYVQSIEIVSPETGNYTKNQVVTLKVNWSENINTTLNTVPELKIKFGKDVEKSVSVKEIGNDYIIYEYVINEDDNGLLEIASYLNGIVTDMNGNNYQQTIISLIGNEIKAGTKAYIPVTGQYYYNLQEAIDNCELNATVYTTIQLLSDDYYFSGITINESQKIEIDLSGKEINCNLEKTIINNGDLKIIDSSTMQTGIIKYIFYGVYNTGRGTVEINGGTISSYAYTNSYGVYNASSGIVEINGGTIRSSSPYSSSSDFYGVYNASDGIIEINGGTISSCFYGVYNASSGMIKINSGTISSYNRYSNLIGVYNVSNGILEINGGTISANSYNSYGVYIDNKDAKVKITGGELKGSANGIYIPEGMTINNSGTEEKGKVNLPQNKHIGYRVEGEYIVNYIEEGEYIVAELTVGEMITQHLSMHDAINSIPTDGSLGIVKLLQNENLGRSLEIREGQNVEIDLNGKEISGNITNNGDLRIIDSSPMQTGIIKLWSFSDSWYGISAICGVYNTGSGIVELNGGKIIGNFSNRGVCGIYNLSDGIIEINGGTIDTYSIQYVTYGVYNENNGIIKINGGTITSSYSSVYNENNGIIEINGGTISSDDYGVYNNNNGIIEINGGTIVSSSVHSSYGVYNYSNGILEINRGTISGYYGVYIKSKDAKIKLTGGEWIGRKNGIYIPEGMEINNSGTEEIGKVNIPQDKHIGYREQSGYIVNYIEDGAYVAELTIGEAITQYVSIHDAINNIPTDSTLGIVKLLQNESLGRSIDIKEGQNVEIDLNGREIRCEIEKTITNNGDLRIIDSSSMQTGTISFYTYGVYNANSGTVEVNGGTISSFSSSNSYGLYFKNTDSYFYFNGGKILGVTNSIYPTTKSIELQPNTYVKNYRENIGGTNYYVAEVAPTSNIKVINNGNISYYEDLKTAMSTTAAPANNTLTEITLMADADILSDITIANGQKILLDLNGKTINVKEYNSISVRKPFINNGIFEIMDSVSSGQINIESTGYDDYGIYNNATTAKYKMYGGTMNVTSIGNNAYGIYNSRSTTDGITIEGGSINVTAKQAENGVTSGKAYGIYNAYSNVVVTGENTNIIATSELNDSYGYYSTYSEKLTLGTKDGLVDNVSPYIVGGTNGIYTNGTIFMYDGEITGPQNASVSKAINNIEDDTIIYVLDNKDGTESTMLLKEVEELIVIPQDISFTEINAKQDIETVYLPIDASNVVVDYKVADESIAEVRMEENKYVVVSRGNGATTITFTVTDMTGKALTAVCNVTVDDLLPSDTAPTAVSTATSVTITCNQTDENGIDVNTVMYAISSDNGATWSEWTNRQTISGLTADTEYLVKTKVSDMSGNESESQTTAIHTKLPNNSTLVLQPDTVTNTDVKVLVTWNNTEGLPQYYKAGEGEWTLVEGETTEITVTENNVTVYTKLVYDGTEDSNINYVLVDNIDRLAPKGTISINEDTTNYTGQITLTISASDDVETLGDNHGAVTYMYLTQDNLSEAPSSGDSNWISWDGNYADYEYSLNVAKENKVYLYLKDKAGNISEPIESDTVEYDLAPVLLIEDDVVIGEYDTIQQAYNVARTGNSSPSIIKIFNSHTMTSQLTIESNKNIVLDLNGKIVSSALAKVILNNGTLEVTDSLGNGKIVANPTSQAYVIDNTNKLTISGGTIEARSTVSGNFGVCGIRNTGSAGNINMTGGKIYVTSTRTSSASSYWASGIRDESSYTGTHNISGGIIEVEALNYCTGVAINSNAYASSTLKISNTNIIVNSQYNDAYGIWKNYKGNVEMVSGTVIANSISGTGNGVDNASGYGQFILGTNDGTVTSEIPIISGSTRGVYNNYGSIHFYDGTISGPEGGSFYYNNLRDITTPQYYGVSKTLENGIETATLMYDNSAPTIEKLNITNEAANSQIITAVNSQDIGTGIVAYACGVEPMAPEKTSYDWFMIDQTNGPIDITGEAYENGTWYFWLMDGAGNISETKSIEAQNIFIPVYDAYIDYMEIATGESQSVILDFDPMEGQPKEVKFEVSDPTIAYVDSSTGIVTGLKAGNAQLRAVIINYNDTIVEAYGNIYVVDNPPEIITEPLDRTVKAGTTTEFLVEASGDKLKYQWYKIQDGKEEVLTQNKDKVYKSNIEGKANGVSTETITIDAASEGSLSFEYMVSSELNNDIFEVRIEDGNGITVAVDNISGEVDWTKYSGEFIPNENGKIIITVIYSKNGSVDDGLDFGAIRNLKWNYYGIASDKSTFTEDDRYLIQTPMNNGETIWVTDIENGEPIFRSDNIHVHNTTASAIIGIKTDMPGRLKFDYKVSCEDTYDYLNLAILDANGVTEVANQLYGNLDWISYSQDVYPDNGMVMLGMMYYKDEIESAFDDMGAIRNLVFESEGYATKKSNFVSDDIFTFTSNNWSTEAFDGTNSPILTIPGSMVNNSLDGTKYFCVVSNSEGVAVSREALLTITDEEIEVSMPLTKFAPTLTLDNNTITAVCNQTGEGIIETYYAISTDDINYSEWQTSNRFTNLEKDKLYYVKTKVVNETEEQESFSAYIVEVGYAVSLTENGETTYYNSVYNALMAARHDEPEEASIITILKDVFEYEIYIAPVQNIKLDLNGCIISLVNNYGGEYRAVINEGKLEIVDNTNVGKIQIKMIEEAEADFYIFGIYNLGGLVITSGCIDIGRVGPFADSVLAIASERGNVTIGNAEDEMTVNTPIIISTGYGIDKQMGTVNFYDGKVISAVGLGVNNTTPLNGYQFKTETSGNQDITYLEATGNSIESAVVTFEPSTYTYDGTAKEPIPTVTLSGDTLIEDEDYTIKFENNIDAGTASVLIKGIGEYAGIKRVNYTINPKEIDVVWGETEFYYTGNPQVPTATAESGIDGEVIELAVSGEQINAGKNYTASIDTFTSTVTGGRGKISNYSFTNPSTLFNIAEDASNKFEITLDNYVFTYDGSAKEPVVTVKIGNETLVENTDYKVTFKDNTEVGTATVIVSGLGKYSGEASENFIIASNDIGNDSTIVDLTGPTVSDITVTLTDKLTITATIEDPNISGDMVGSGVDESATRYAITADNTAPASDSDKWQESNVFDMPDGSTAFVWVKAVDNVGNETIQGLETVVSKKISSLDIQTSPSSFEYDGTAKTLNITIKDNDYTLVEGTDYTVSYENNTNAGTAKLTITGKGIYIESHEVEFTITKRNLTVTPKPNQSATFGQTVKIDYDFAGNVSGEIPGFTGTLALVGENTSAAGTYTISQGTLTLADNDKFLVNNYTLVFNATPVTFEITAKEMNSTNTEIVLSPLSFVYDGTAKIPNSVVVTVDSMPLVEGKDYTVAYTNNVDAGTAVATFTGIGNYAGTVIANYEITARDLDITVDSYSSAYDGLAHGVLIGGADASDVTITYDTDISDGTYDMTTAPTYTDVGTYTVYVKVEKPSCNTVTRSATVTITAKPITVIWGSTVLTYQTGKSQAPEANAPSGVDGEEIVLKVDGAQVNVGPAEGKEYKAIVSIASVTNGKATNYTLLDTERTFSIVLDPGVEFNVELEDKDETFTYTGEAHTPNIVVKVGSETLDPETDYDVSYTNNKDAGTATITVTGKGNYAGVEEVITFEINKKDLVVTPNAGQTKVFGTATQTIGYAFSGNVEGEEPDFNGTLDIAIPSGSAIENMGDIGEYVIVKNTLELKDNDPFLVKNYNLVFTENVVYTITAKSLNDLTISLDNGTFEYTGNPNEPKPEIVFNGTPLVLGDDFTVSYDNNVNAGIAKVTITGNGNFEGSKEINFTISPKEIVVTWGNTNFTFIPGVAQAPVAGTNNTLAGVNGETINLNIAGAEINVGPANGEEYKAIASIASVTKADGTQGEVTNYTLKNKEVTFDIVLDANTEFDITFKNTEDSLVEYTGAPHTPEIEVKVGDTVLVKDTDYTVDYGDNNTDAGEVTVIITGKGNYDGVTGEIKFTIAPKEITVVWGSTTLTYIPETEQAPIAGTNNTLAGVNGETIMLKVDGGKTNVGPAAGDEYKAVASITSVVKSDGTQGKAANYVLKGNETPFEIVLDAATEFSISFENTADANVIYKGTAYMPKVIVKAGTTLLVEDRDYTLAYTNNVNAGEATITVTGIGNYAGVSGELKFIISPKPIAIVWKNTSLTYIANTIQAPVAGTNNVVPGVNGETINVEVSGGQTNVGPLDGEEYIATATMISVDKVDDTQGKVENYVLTNPTVAFTISLPVNTAFDITFANGEESFEYNGGAHTPEIIVKANGTTLKLDVDYTVAYTQNVNAGTATITVTGINNYDGINGTKTFTIDKKDLIVTPDSNQSMIYGETMPELKYTWSGNVSGETPLFSGDLSKENGSDVGTYVITAGNLKLENNGSFIANNYNLVVEDNVTFEICQADINNATITLTPNTFEYDGNAKTPEASVVVGTNTLTEDEDFEVSYKNNTEIGTGTVVITGIGNYKGEKEVTFIIQDTTAPDAPIIKATVTSYDGNAYIAGTATNKNVFIELSSNESGITHYEWSLSQDNGFTSEGITVVEGKGRISFTTEMDQTIYFRSKDANDNYSSVSSIAIKIDRTAPDGIITIVPVYEKDGQKATNSNKVKINVEVTDNYSEASNIDIALINEVDYNAGVNEDNITWLDYAPQIEWQLTPGQGRRRVYVIIRDEAGNKSKQIAQ